MAEFKRFMFDNFIVGGCDTKLPEPLPEITMEGENSDYFADFQYGDSGYQDDNIETNPEVEVIAPTFTQEELNSQIATAVSVAEQNSYDRGYNDAQQEIVAESNRLMNDISQKLTILLSQTDENEKKREQEAMKVLQQALHTLVPTLLEEQAVDLVNKFLSDNFNNFKHNEKLSFYINPNIISYIQDSIVKLANSHDFEGKISIHKDSNLDKSSCRVEWDNGGVEYAPSEQLAIVENMLVDSK